MFFVYFSQEFILPSIYFIVIGKFSSLIAWIMAAAQMDVDFFYLSSSGGCDVIIIVAFLLTDSE
jgi:phosphate starvation-inducible membrane PsiE